MDKKRFVCLDRDGTIIEERLYLSDPQEVILLPRAAQGLRRMKEMGLGLVVVTNQSGIGRGFFDESRLQEIHDRMKKLLKKEGIVLDGLYYCPHTPQEGCLCRKPQTGLIEKASRDLNFIPETSFMIGDNVCDIQLGKRIKAKTILVKTGYGTTVATSGEADPDHIANDLTEATEIIKDLLS